MYKMHVIPSTKIGYRHRSNSQANLFIKKHEKNFPCKRKLFFRRCIAFLGDK